MYPACLELPHELAIAAAMSRKVERKNEIVQVGTDEMETTKEGSKGESSTHESKLGERQNCRDGGVADYKSKT
jgi:hypothetical protein